jgi:hypothetical protein
MSQHVLFHLLRTALPRHTQQSTDLFFIAGRSEGVFIAPHPPLLSSCDVPGVPVPEDIRDIENGPPKVLRTTSTFTPATIAGRQRESE